jgi:hypothetical protein
MTQEQHDKLVAEIGEARERIGLRKYHNPAGELVVEITFRDKAQNELFENGNPCWEMTR